LPRPSYRSPRPFACAAMLNVRRIDERDQNIDVEEKPHHGSSSRS
jgi:hypothetical protein